MMQQYQELKRRYPDHLLFFRLGDFYESFFEDAELAARLLQITLTSRQGAPMAGIPHHAADGYIARLVPGVMMRTTSRLRSFFVLPGASSCSEIAIFRPARTRRAMYPSGRKIAISEQLEAPGKTK